MQTNYADNNKRTKLSTCPACGAEAYIGRVRGDYFIYCSEDEDHPTVLHYDRQIAIDMWDKQKRIKR